MGERGPVPKRSEKRLGHRAAAEKKIDKPAAVPKTPPKPRPSRAKAAPKLPAEWHPFARAWFEALATSGQSAYYQPSDWATAYVAAEQISRELNPRPMITAAGVEIVKLPITGAGMAAFLRSCAVLLVTEGDRRRAAVELEQHKAGEEKGNVSQLAEYRRRLNS